MGFCFVLFSFFFLGTFIPYFINRPQIRFTFAFSVVKYKIRRKPQKTYQNNVRFKMKQEKKRQSKTREKKTEKKRKKRIKREKKKKRRGKKKEGYTIKKRKEE